MEPLNDEEKSDKVKEIWSKFDSSEKKKSEMILEVEKLKALWGIHESLQDLYLLIADRF